MDHYQVLVPDVLATAKFYMDLGFRISDYLYVEAAQRVVGTFLHRKDNPWDIVLLTRSGPRFHHGGYVVEAFEDIVRACDVAGNLGFADRIEHGPGRHGHQHSYYLYVRDPDGHRTELLLPGIQIIDIDDEPMMCPVNAQRELEPVGAAGAEKLGRGGDQFRRRRDEADDGRLADDRGALSGGEEEGCGRGIVPSKRRQADAPAGTSVRGAPPGESAPWVPSTDRCSPRTSARASRFPWRRRRGAPGRRPAGPVRASGSCARNRASR